MIAQVECDGGNTSDFGAALIHVTGIESGVSSDIAWGTAQVDIA